MGPEQRESIRMENTKGQIEVTFNWFYVLIAGGVILLFFVGIVYKQKAATEEQISYDVVRVMESILTAAGVSEKTKNVIDIGGLAEHTLEFTCEDGVAYYGIKDSPARAEIPLEPVFAPRELKTSHIIAWSLPYNLPYKVIDLLFVSSPNTKYFVVGGYSEFALEFMNATNGFNVEIVDSVEEIDPGKNFQVRLIDVSGQLVQDKSSVPEMLHSFDDDKVTAVAFVGENQVVYFLKQGTHWKRLHQNPIQIISLGQERDAARYAAVFAADDQVYVCNMKKVFKRFGFVTEVYQGKLQTITQYQEQDVSSPLTSECLGHLTKYDKNMESVLGTHATRGEVCLKTPGISSCADLVLSAHDAQEINKKLEVNCVPLY